MLKMLVFERSRRELSLDVSLGVHILLVVELSSLESQSINSINRGCAKTVNTDTHGTITSIVRLDSQLKSFKSRTVHSRIVDNRTRNAGGVMYM